MNKNMTAVEWYADNQSQLLMRLLKKELENENEYPNMARAIKAEALEMERNQIIDAYKKGQSLGFDDNPNYMAEKYYEETFTENE